MPQLGGRGSSVGRIVFRCQQTPKDSDHLQSACGPRQQAVRAKGAVGPPPELHAACIHIAEARSLSRHERTVRRT